MTLKNYRPNPSFIPFFLKSQDAEDIVKDAAEKAAEMARATAPVDTGEYRDSIHVEGADVVSDDDAALFIEFGTVDTPTFAPLRKGAEQAGLEVKRG